MSHGGARDAPAKASLSQKEPWNPEAGWARSRGMDAKRHLTICTIRIISMDHPCYIAPVALHAWLPDFLHDYSPISCSLDLTDSNFGLG